ncbi:UTRA domain-containing protein [Sandaracinobacter neustonicus]|uniref:UTRA domain-containing protein n=1 Tax=Sandaracinobacter neustonicus TaxID=1715348 RepID=A0A501XKC8_9SPHN|nr:UTRA domain-containing protein [Sandaracinobacter neustonicus]TPE61132.1 UTRA domain-containing protein [Sandaracinobacter neustonicus]
MPTQRIEGAGIPPLDGEGPLWLQIRRAIAQAILSGEWTAGTRIPAELVLTSHYQTSRMTVNKAIQSLAAEGLVARRPRLGTVVTGRARERPVLEIWDAADAVHRSGGRYGYRLIDCAMVSSEDGLEGAPSIRILCLHLADDQPFQLEERLVSRNSAPTLACAHLHDVSPGQWLLANVPWTRAGHSLTARGATPLVAQHLALAEGAACLVVERRTWNGDAPVTFGRFWYPGDDDSQTARFRPSW